MTGIVLNDFKAFRLIRNYYIDKTEFIKHIIDNQSSVTVLTRPRRNETSIYTIYYG